MSRTDIPGMSGRGVSNSDASHADSAEIAPAVVKPRKRVRIRIRTRIRRKTAST